LTTITVANNANSGAGSLRQAFIDASNGGPAQSDDVLIVIPASVGNISLTSGELLYDGGDTATHALTLQGGGNTITQATANNRVIHDTANSLFTMSGLVITGGHAPAAQAGGGIFVQGAATISSSSITGNTAPDAGGAFVNGNAIVTGSTISGNNAGGTGGGLYGNGTITLTNSTVTGNMSSNVAGGVRSDGGTITLIYSTVAGNTGGG